ncbi:MAG: hypothetical protein ABF420_09070 [Acetobacter syzygii]|uniref:hypothetical protein n=1 Tax=Acetobacter syzygii TaxID=146476 RepID=UPI0039EBEB11
MSKLLNCTNDDILDMFPRIKNLSGSPFDEDADIFGDTLREVIQNVPQTHDLPFKQQTVNELSDCFESP